MRHDSINLASELLHELADRGLRQMFGLGIGQLVIVGLVFLLLFGKRLPSTMRSLGSSLNAFKGGLEDGLEEDQKLLS